MINTVTIVGNLGQDPEIRYTPSGVPVANFTVAVNEVYTNKDGQKVKKGHWFKVTAFKRLAEIVGEYCAKGSRIGVRGQLQYRLWQDDEGGNQSLVEIRARELELLSGKNGKPAASERRPRRPPQRTTRSRSEGSGKVQIPPTEAAFDRHQYMKKASRKIPEMPFLLRIAALFYLCKIKEMWYPSAWNITSLKYQRKWRIENPVGGYRKT